MKNYTSRYLGEAIFVIVLMIIILILMLAGSLKGQTVDPSAQTNFTTDSLRNLGLMSVDHNMQAKEAATDTKTNYDLTNAKIFVLDENVMFEMMKQDEKIANIMSAAIIKAMQNDVRICEFVTNKITENTTCKMGDASYAKASSSIIEKTSCNCSCACCKKDTASHH